MPLLLRKGSSSCSDIWSKIHWKGLRSSSHCIHQTYVASFLTMAETEGCIFWCFLPGLLTPLIPPNSQILRQGQKKPLWIVTSHNMQLWRHGDTSSKDHTPFFWPHHTSCGILVPWRGVEPMAPTLETWCLNCWTTRAVPGSQISCDQQILTT